MTRMINGEPYCLTFHPNDPAGPGWKVTRAVLVTDRFFRAYWVRSLPNGTPLRCSCSDCHHRGNWCKHCKAVEALRRGLDPTIQQKVDEDAAMCGFPV